GERPRRLRAAHLLGPLRERLRPGLGDRESGRPARRLRSLPLFGMASLPDRAPPALRPLARRTTREPMDRRRAWSGAPGTRAVSATTTAALARASAALGGTRAKPS